MGYRSEDELIEKLHYYLDHPAERERIARNGYRRVMETHRIRTRLEELADLVNVSLSERG